MPFWPKYIHFESKVFLIFTGIGFRTNEKLYIHLTKKHGAPRTHPCSESGCNKAYNSKAELGNHFRAIHSKICPFTCQFCGKSFSRANVFRDHERRHTFRYKCEKCQQSYITNLGLKRHICGAGRAPWGTRQPKTHRTRKVVPLAERLHPCNQCNSAFSTKDNLKSHLKLHSPKNPNVCHFCSKPFLCHAYLAKHMKKVHGIESDEKRDWRSNKRPRQCHKDTGFSCPVCFAIFPYESSFKQHMKSHDNNISKNVCTVCNKKFSNEVNLQSHLQSHLVGNTTKSTSKQHRRGRKRKWVPSERKDFACNLCRSSFMLENTLIKHMTVHHPGV